MEKALVVFSNGEKIEIAEGDFIIPVAKSEHDGESFASMRESVEIYTHVHDGLIPAIADVLCCYSHFYINHDNSKLYSSSAVVKVERL